MSKKNKELIPVKRETTKRAQKWHALTSKLNVKQLNLFTGHENCNLKKISEHFLSIPIFVSNKRIYVTQKELDQRFGRDPGLAARLTNVCFALESITAKAGKINDINIEHATDTAFNMQEDSLNGVIEITKEGKKLDNKNIIIPDLADSVLFENFIIQTTCAEDSSVTPSQTILFLPSGKAVFSRVVGKNNQFLKEIKGRLKGVTFRTNGSKTPRIKISGDLDTVEKARNCLITFTHLIAEFGYKKEAHLKQALLCAFGDLKPNKLPASKSAAKKSEGANDIDFKSMTINAFTPKSQNQEDYLNMLDRNDYPAVLAQGPAGTGKTRLFLQVAMRKIRDHYCGMTDEPFNKLILSIPLVNVGGKDLGAMPGNLNQKTGMWFETYYSHLVRILSPIDMEGKADLSKGMELLDALKERGIIEIAPLEFLRGKSFDGALVALDEAQNTTPEQIKTFLTRAEETSRLFAFGDLEQTDRSKQTRPTGEPFKVPSTVKIDDKGLTSIYSGGKWIVIGFHKDIGHFSMGTEPGHVETVYPHNGFAQALLLYSGSPSIGCTSLDFSDIFRSGVGRDLLVLHRGLRIVGDEKLNSAPLGNGKVDPSKILAAQTKKDLASKKDAPRVVPDGIEARNRAALHTGRTEPQHLTIQ